MSGYGGHAALIYRPAVAMPRAPDHDETLEGSVSLGGHVVGCHNQSDGDGLEMRLVGWVTGTVCVVADHGRSGKVLCDVVEAAAWVSSRPFCVMRHALAILIHRALFRHGHADHDDPRG